KYFRQIAYGLETGKLTVEAAQRFLFLRNGISRALKDRKMGGLGGGAGAEHPTLPNDPTP
ncbi:MAG: hypothetical protein KJS98_19880, partial [Nitrospirae bacterium]|nr:hypothetical protein [Nitrospirota bacterium]